MDILGLCRYVRSKNPFPASTREIQASVNSYTKEELSNAARQDLVKVLAAQWKRDGWDWDEKCAVKLDPDEEAFFHERGVSLIKPAPNERIFCRSVKIGEHHARVVWF